jgi:hypothetical protein
VAIKTISGRAFDPSAPRVPTAIFPAELVYARRAIRRVLRCTIPDYQMAILGASGPPAVWSAVESAVRAGLCAACPVGNRRRGSTPSRRCSPARFLPEAVRRKHLNEKLGSFDQSTANPIPQSDTGRIPGSGRGSPYRAGQVTDAHE